MTTVVGADRHVGPGADTPVRPYKQGGDGERGRETFTRVGCYQCHGREAQGASTGPRLGPDPMPLAQFTRAIRTLRADMPPYSPKILSDTELADIYAYVATRSRPRPRPRKTRRHEKHEKT